MSDERSPTPDLLRALLLGERSPDDEEVRAALERDPRLRGAWREHRGTSRLLDAAGRFETGVLRDAATLDDAPAAKRLEERVPGLQGRPRHRRAWLAAAALLLAAGLLFVLTRPDPTEVAPLHLGQEGGVELLHPLGAVPRYAPFSWETSKLPRGGSFTVLLYDGTSADRELLHRERRVRTPRWTPSPELARDLPPRIGWRVLVVDSGGQEVAASAVGEAWVSGH